MIQDNHSLIFLETSPILRYQKVPVVYNGVGNADSDSGSDSESESEKVVSPAKVAKVLWQFTIGCFKHNADL